MPRQRLHNDSTYSSARWKALALSWPLRARLLLARLSVWPYLWLGVLYFLALCAFRSGH